VAGPCLGNVRAAPATSRGGRRAPPRKRPSGPVAPLAGVLAQAPPDRTAQTWAAAGRGHGTDGTPDLLSGTPFSGPLGQRFHPTEVDRHPDIPRNGYRGGGAPTSKDVRAASPPLRRPVPPVPGATVTPKGNPPLPRGQTAARGGFGARLGILPSGPVAPHTSHHQKNPMAEHRPPSGTAIRATEATPQAIPALRVGSKPPLSAPYRRAFAVRVAFSYRRLGRVDLP